MNRKKMAFIFALAVASLFGQVGQSHALRYPLNAMPSPEGTEVFSFGDLWDLLTLADGPTPGIASLSQCKPDHDCNGETDEDQDLDGDG